MSVRQQGGRGEVEEMRLVGYSGGASSAFMSNWNNWRCEGRRGENRKEEQEMEGRREEREWDG